jgi:hypothetical protein
VAAVAALVDGFLRMSVTYVSNYLTGRSSRLYILRLDDQSQSRIICSLMGRLPADYVRCFLCEFLNTSVLHVFYLSHPVLGRWLYNLRECNHTFENRYPRMVQDFRIMRQSQLILVDVPCPSWHQPRVLHHSHFPGDLWMPPS